MTNCHIRYTNFYLHKFTKNKSSEPWGSISHQEPHCSMGCWSHHPNMYSIDWGGGIVNPHQWEVGDNHYHNATTNSWKQFGTSSWRLPKIWIHVIRSGADHLGLWPPWWKVRRWCEKSWFFIISYWNIRHHTQSYRISTRTKVYQPISHQSTLSWVLLNFGVNF